MISKWGVTNFKSIREVNLDLAPLTIFTGVNNSGKSSFLQSLAMMAQSLEELHIKLNGCYVELDNFENIYHNKASKENKTINIRFETKKRKFASSYSLYKYPRDNSVIKVSGVKFNKSDDEYDDDNTEDEENGFDVYDDDNIEYVENGYDVYDDNNTEDEDIGYAPYDDNNIEYEEIKENTDKEKNTEFFDVLLSKFTDALLSVNELKTQFNYVGDKYPKIANFENERKYIEIIWEGFRPYFSDKYFRYLGPFRKPPQFSDKKDADKKNEFVNSDGSNTFAVLNKWYKENVPYCLPDNISKKEYTDKDGYTLIYTLDKWLKHFELADTCRVDKEGVILFNIGGKEYTLSQLGSGVSQILPIFVMCLTAPKNSTIIIQEPEAHYHPKVQSRLADFFIAMALTGRQCIIETHSEYIIEQLRYRILMMSDLKPEPLHKLVKLYFVTKNDGCSDFKYIAIDEDASLDEWPEDFFDESHKLVRKMMEAADKKEERDRKKRDRKNG